MARIRPLRYLGIPTLLSLLLCVQAQPNSFPENAVELHMSYGSGIAFALGGEVRLPFDAFDGSVSLQLFRRGFLSSQNNDTSQNNNTSAPYSSAPQGSSHAWGGRLAASALAFPAMGTYPPLAVGIAGDVGYDTVSGFAVHLGPTVGTDLLFLLDRPVTLSVYIGAGYSNQEGFSVAWNNELRYYLSDMVALEFANSDIAPLSIALRYAFY